MTTTEKIQAVVEDLEQRGLWISWKIVHNYLLTFYPAPCPTVQEIQEYLQQRERVGASRCPLCSGVVENADFVFCSTCRALVGG